MSRWAVTVLIGVERDASSLGPLRKTSEQPGGEEEGIATGPAHTHRIPPPVLTPRQGSGHAPPGGALATALRPAGGGGVLRRLPDGFHAFSLPPQAASSSPQPHNPQGPQCPGAEHLPLAVAERFREAVAIAIATARRLFPLVEREDLIQVAREALVRSAPRCRAGEPAEPYLRRCIQGALQHHLRDRVRLVRVPRRLHEQGQCPLGHSSLDAQADGEPCMLDQLAAPEAEPAISETMDGLALDKLPAAEATALRLTVLEGLSLRQAPMRLEISRMSVQRAQKKALVALRLQLAGGG